MASRRVTVRVPATSGNLGAGFDCLGLALDLWAEVTVAVGEARPAQAKPIEALVLEAARACYQSIGQRAPEGLSAVWSGPVPVARGLGASAAARVGGLLAAGALAGDPPDHETLLALAARLEGHADNAAPALFGGLQVVVRDGHKLLHTGAPLPPGLRVVLLVPDLEMSTQESRRLLPAELSLEDAVHNIGRAALLVAALAGRRFDLLDVATQDRLHQPTRAKLFPAMDDVFAAAREAGSLCAWLSGGGSTVAALALGNEERIGRAMAEAAGARGYGGKTVITAPTEQGARIIEPEDL